MVASAETNSSLGADRRISVARVAAAGGVTALVLFWLCWVAALLRLGATHMYLDFVGLPGPSFGALLVGTICSFAVGGAIAGLFAIVYNASAGLERQ